jgi:hypothetical protein
MEQNEFLPAIRRRKGGDSKNERAMPHWLFDDESDVPEFEEFPG